MSNLNANPNRLQGKDLINVGIFTAIYFVIVLVVAMLSFGELCCINYHSKRIYGSNGQNEA